MTAYRLVPVIPTDEQRKASADVPFHPNFAVEELGAGARPLWLWVADSGLDQTAVDCGYTAMVKAAPNSLPDADRDHLCRMMWGDKWWWGREHDNDPPHRQSQDQRNSDRIRMGIFLLNLSMLKDAPTPPEGAHE